MGGEREQEGGGQSVFFPFTTKALRVFVVPAC